MTSHEIKISFKEYDTLTELTPPDYSLCLEAVKTMENSHSPYSKSPMGSRTLANV